MKPRKRSERAVAGALALLDAARVREPGDLDVEALAAACGAYVVYGSLPREDGNRLRAGGATIITVREAWRGTPRGLFTIAHETGHNAMHAEIDQLGRCTDGDGTERDARWQLEREADDFAAELILTEAFVRPEIARMERSASLAFDDVCALGDRFRASPEATGVRVAEFVTDAEVALVCSRDGHVQWAIESIPYDGRIVKRRALAKGTIARRLGAETGVSGAVVRDDVPGELWGTGGRLIEESVRTDYGVVLSWLRRSA